MSVNKLRLFLAVVTTFQKPSRIFATFCLQQISLALTLRACFRLVAPDQDGEWVLMVTYNIYVLKCR